MVAVAKPRYVTPQEYLAWERRAETRSEYHNGIMVAMAGASWEHGIITGNIQTELNTQLRATPCATITQDLRVRVPECNKYYYPDVVVVCEDPQFEDTEHDTLLNPTLIVEVLSPSTERKDRGEKFDCYQTLDSFTTYVLVAQEEPRVECFMRQSDGAWLYQRAVGLSASLTLPSIGCTLQLTDLYARVTFPSSDPDDIEENTPPA